MCDRDEFYPCGNIRSDASDILDRVRDYTSPLSRGPASNVIHRVAEMGWSGNFPTELTCEDLGSALARIIPNSNEDKPLVALVSGYLQRARGTHYHDEAVMCDEFWQIMSDLQDLITRLIATRASVS